MLLSKREKGQGENPQYNEREDKHRKGVFDGATAKEYRRS
ncbi:hypothetical protein BLGI_2781 [Brevibacillus laterosporus GI-9]|nr:hypothetical protein BLGI_2781 [Brevibacillus laterosporus GI-9]